MFVLTTLGNAAMVGPFGNRCGVGNGSGWLEASAITDRERQLHGLCMTPSGPAVGPRARRHPFPLALSRLKDEPWP